MTDWDDDWEDDDVNEVDDDAAETVPCPACGELIYEEAEQCPHCGEYVTRSTSALAGRPWWFSALGIGGVIAVIIYYLSR